MTAVGASPAPALERHEYALPTVAQGRSSTWRWPAAASALLAAGAPLPVLPEHLREAPYLGVLLTLVDLAVLGVAAALLLNDTPTRYRTLAGLCRLPCRDDLRDGHHGLVDASRHAAGPGQGG